MPVTAIGGRGVIETGAFVMPRTAAEAVLSLQGAVLTVRADASLSTGTSTSAQGANGPVLSFGPFGGGNNLHLDVALTVNGLTYTVHFIVAVVDGPNGRDYSVVYSLVK